MHIHPSQRILSMVLAALLSIGLLSFPAPALAAPSDAGNYWDFITATECDQLTMGTDDNSYCHSDDDFPDRYVLDEVYQKDLFAKCVNDKEYNAIVDYMDKEWGGSCYGISATMVLSRLSTTGFFGPNEGLRPGDMQNGATKYFDIAAPVNNRTALNWINYFMLSQNLSASTANAVTMFRSSRVGGKMAYGRAALTAVVDKIKYYVDNGMPFQTGYGYSKGGHAIVGVDYYLSPADANGRKILYLKFYDENDRGSAPEYAATPRFCYIKLQWTQAGGYEPLPEHTDSNGNERVYLYYYNYSKQAYCPTKLLTYLKVRDMKTIYNNLNPDGALYQTASVVNALNGAAPTPMLTLEDAETLDETKFRIKPFAYDSGDVDKILYADDCGSLYSVSSGDVSAPSGDSREGNPPATETYPPIPVDAANTDLDFAHMTAYRYTNAHEGDVLDMELDLKTRGAVGGVQKNFDGYDIVLSDAYLPGASLLCGDHYAWANGNGIDYVRFSSDGRLRDVIAGPDGGDLSLYFGTDSDNMGLDMFRVSLNDFSYLMVYDHEDGPQFDGSVVLRTDGLSGDFDFAFYRDELTSGDYALSIEDPENYPDGVWVKLCAEEDDTGALGVSLWTAPVLLNERDEPYAPVFASAPDDSTLLHTRVFSSAGSGSASVSGAGGSTLSSYPFKGSANGERLSDGGLRFVIDAAYEKQTGAAADGRPLQKGVDYTVESGSTIVTLTPAFLASLKDGSHTLAVYFTDGVAKATFTTPLANALSAVPDVPATGGAPLWAAMLSRLFSR